MFTSPHTLTLLRYHELRTTRACALSRSTRPALSIFSLAFVSRYFDQDGDGSLDRGEFFYLVEYVVAMNIIDASKGSVSLDDDDSR